MKKVIISPKSIYKFVNEYNLESFLCFKGKERKSNSVYIYRKAKELDKARIKDRPAIEGVYGHYEMDFIVSSVFHLLSPCCHGEKEQDGLCKKNSKQNA